MKINTNITPLAAVSGFKVAVLGALALFAVSASSEAVVQNLPPGGTLSPVPTQSFAGGTLQASIVNAAFNTPHLGGTYSEYVYKEAGGTFDFYYQFTVNSQTGGAPGDGITTLSLPDYTLPTGLLIEAFYINDGTFPIGPTGSIAPFSITRLGSTLNVNYSAPPVMPVNTTYFVGIKTNAPAFAPDILGLQNGGNSGNLPAYVPVPEPTAALFGLTLLGIVGVARRNGRSSDLATA